MEKYSINSINSIPADSTGNVPINKATVGLNNVDNTSDSNKPTSTAVQTALDLKAPTASPTFTGAVSGITATMVGLNNVNNTSDVNKPVSTAQATADTSTLNSAKTYADSLVLGLVDDRGGYDASTNLFPVAGGSGVAGVILKGDQWEITVTGILGSKTVDVGDLVRALVDTPAQVSTSWFISSYNTQQATTSIRGTVKLATDAEAITGTNTDKAIVPSSLVAKLNNYNTNTLATTYETILNVNKLKSTRVISGTGVSINGDTTKFNIQVVGEIVDPNTSVTTAINVNLTAEPVTNLGIQTESYVTINSSGTVVQSLTLPDPTTFDSILGTWVLIHSNLTNLNAVNNFPMYADGTAIQLHQLLEFDGFRKKSGSNIVSAGTTGTRISHTGGLVIKNGGGGITKRPMFTLTSAIDATFRMRNRDDIEGVDTQTLDVTNIDIAGVTTALTNNKFGAHKVWKFSSSLMRVQRGQKEYNNFSDAIAGINVDSYIDSPNGLRNGIHIGWIVFKKGTTWAGGVSGTDYLFVDVRNGVSAGTFLPTLQTVYSASAINIVLIKSVNDFPTPVANNITLANNTAYQTNGPVNIGINTITFGTSNLIFGLDKSSDQLIYTGTSTMLINANKDCTVAFLTLSAITAGGSVYGFTGSTNKLEIRDVIYGNCKSLGTINGCDVLVHSKNLVTGCTTGITIQGTCNYVNLADALWEGNLTTMTCISIPSGTFKQLKISRNEFDVATTQTAISVGTPTVINAVISDCDFLGAGTYLSGVNQITAGWELRSSRGVGIINNPPYFRVQPTNVVNSNIVTNTTTETNFTGTGLQFTVSANNLRVGSRIAATAWILQSSLGSTLNIRSKGGSAGTTTFAATGARTSSVTTNAGTYLVAEYTVRSIGASGTCNAQIIALYQEGTFTDGIIIPSNGTKTIDTTTVNIFGLSAQWGAASTTNQISAEDITWEIFY